ncbi:hypothetical protein AWB94_20480 [Mycolicibacterium canariasense]|nr:hypothetical protein AWB94_20480 [Mycolicibacterium canariasense]
MQHRRPMFAHRELHIEPVPADRQRPVAADVALISAGYPWSGQETQSAASISTWPQVGQMNGITVTSN